MGDIPTNSQPMPKSGDQEVMPELIKLLQERYATGVKKYGTSLHTFNGRKNLIDAIEESLDLCIYLTAEKMERDKINSERDALIKQVTDLTNLKNEIRSHLDNPAFDSKTTVRFIESSVEKFENSKAC